MSKKGVSAVRGNISPIVGEKTVYAIADWYPDTPESDRNPEKVTWELFKKRSNGNFTSTNIKKTGDSSFTFGESATGHTYRLEAYLYNPEGGGLIITPQRNKIPQISKIELLYVDDTKGNEFSFLEKMRAKAHCINMFNKELVFTLWEDDAKGSGHNAQNQAIETKKARVDKNGVATVDFMLTKALMQKAMKGETDVKQLEFYVTVEYYTNKKHATDNVNTNNPFPQQQKPSSTTPPPKAKNSPAAQKPQSKKEEKGIWDSVVDWWGELWDHGEAKGTATKDKEPTIEKPDGRSMASVGKTEPEKKEEHKCPNCEKKITADDLKTIFPQADTDKLTAAANAYNKYMKDLNMNTCWNKAHFFAQAKIESGDALNLKDGENMNYAVEALPNYFSAFSTTGKRYGPPNDLAFKYGRIDTKNIELLKTKYNKPNLQHQSANWKMITNTAYSNRKELGNTGGDDGWNFRGRGLIQITGRNIYTFCNPYTIKYEKEDVLANPDLVGEKISLGVSTSMIFFLWKKINKIANGTKDVKGKICPWVGNNADIKNSKGVKISTNYDEKQKAFDNITSKVFLVDECLWGKVEEKKDSKCPDDCSQCFDYADVWDNPEISSDNHGKNNNRFGRSARGHQGIDILSGPQYKDVHSLMCGEVEAIVTSFKTNQYGYRKLGNVVNVKSKDKNGNLVYILYCHLDKVYVKVGDKVKHGQKIALSGSTGNAAQILDAKGNLLHGIQSKNWHCHIEASSDGAGVVTFYGKSRLQPEDYMKTKFDENGNAIK